MRIRHWRRWLAIGVAAALAVGVAGPFVYLRLIAADAPPPLALATPSTAASPSLPASDGTDGAWRVADGSVVGYRVEEVLFGQSNTAVGRTGSVTGSMTVSGTTITAAAFTVDMTTVTSDEPRRDGQFDGRIMETATYPTATFTLTQPIDVGSVPAEGVRRTYRATGDLTMHGVTRPVTVDLSGRLTGSTAQIAGSIPITFADWNIANPSFGPVTTRDHGVLEFALNLTRA